MNYEICLMVYVCSCLTLDLYGFLQLEAFGRLPNAERRDVMMSSN